MMNATQAAPYYRANAAYQPMYPDPLTVQAGEALTVTDRTDLWLGHPEWVWVWCVDARGKAGWVPQHFVTGSGSAGQARYAYSSAELPVAAGEVVRAVYAVNGWAWCANARGRWGWLPLDHITRVTD